MIWSLLLVIAISFCQNNQILQSDNQLTSLSALSINPSPCKSSNAYCKWNVGQTQLGVEKTVTAVLLKTCLESNGYEITFVDAEHYEYLNITKNIKVVIIGGYKDLSNTPIRTIWRYSQQTETQNSIIFITQGELTLDFIELRYQFIAQDSGIPFPSPSENLIFASGNPSDIYRASLTIQNCEFQGFGLNRTSVNRFVYASYCKLIEINDCNIHDANLIRSAVALGGCSRISIKNNFLTNMNSDYEQESASVLEITYSDENVIAEIEISGNNFDSCSTQTFQRAGAIFIRFDNRAASLQIGINNNKFIRCQGLISGAIYLAIRNCHLLQIKDNEFFENEKNPYLFGDVYILKTDNDMVFPSQGYNSYEEYFIDALLGSRSNLANSVYYEVYDVTSNNINIYSSTFVQNVGIDKKYVLQTVLTNEVASVSLALGDQLQTKELIISLVAPSIEKHTEIISIDSTNGCNRDKIWIVGNSERKKEKIRLGGSLQSSEGTGLFIINIEQTVIGDIYIQKIEQQHWKGGFIKAEGSRSINLLDCRLVGGGTIQHNTAVKLSITKCSFTGDGINNVNQIIEPFIVATLGSIDIYGTQFTDGYFSGNNLGCIVCSRSSTQCLISNSQFLNNKLDADTAAISITTTSCSLLQIGTNSIERSIFSSVLLNDNQGGNYIRSLASNNNISYTDFEDISFTLNGNAVQIEAQQTSDITFIECKYDNISGAADSLKSRCIHSSISSTYGFKFVAQSTIFNDISYACNSNSIGNAVTLVAGSSSVSSVLRQIQFNSCKFEKIRGFGYGGAIALDIRAKTIFQFNNNRFQFDRGFKGSDIWIRTVNSAPELNSTHFYTSRSNSFKPHIIITRDGSNDSAINLGSFKTETLNTNQQYSQSDLGDIGYDDSGEAEGEGEEQIDSDQGSIYIETEPPQIQPRIDEVIFHTQTTEQIVVVGNVGIIKNEIGRLINNGQSVSITLSLSQIYEEINLQQAQLRQVIIMPHNPMIATQANKPVVQPLETENAPLLTIRGDAKVQFESLTLAHFNQNINQPVIKTEANGVLRLVDVTLSPQKRYKTTQGIDYEPTSTKIKNSPFILANGKQVVLDYVIMEPTTFIGCSGITIKGSKGNNKHTAIITDSEFNSLGVSLNSGQSSAFNSIYDDNGVFNANEQEQGSAIEIVNFTAIIQNTTFKGVPSEEVNEGQVQGYCEWSTGAIQVERSIVWIENSTFTELQEGGIKIKAGGKVTLTGTTKLYGNKLPVINGWIWSARRNIVCQSDTNGQFASLRADFGSFTGDGFSEKLLVTSKNKWIQENRESCKITGSLGEIKTNLLYSPVIQNFTASNAKKITGIDVVIHGETLVGCGKLWIEVQLRADKKSNNLNKLQNIVNNIRSRFNSKSRFNTKKTQILNPTQINADDKDDDKIKTMRYRLEDIASLWENDTYFEGTITKDDLIKRGITVNAHLIVETRNGTFQKQDVVEGDQVSPDFRVTGHGLTDGEIAGIVVASVIFVSLLVILIICFYLVYQRKKEAGPPKKQSAKRKQYVSQRE
ncbi:MAG: hypothetical protein EZS28_005359 [Streblomastix strix]|uniref:Right handed beta helix domain-containing protein n=1 Tax=Streblomastix strix TaxID=222440 RepID=A0A5J4WVW5_9EUKA|nr:MAG: hypothetical protein EZS28_005359 [Streblomastix strix]